MSYYFKSYGLQPTKLLCPLDLPGKNIGVGCHTHLQGIFPTHESNWCLLQWQESSLPIGPAGKPIGVNIFSNQFFCFSRKISRNGMEHGKYYSLDSRESLAFIDYSLLASGVIESNLLFLLHNRPVNWKDKVLRQ